jgi:hypothetical protein
MSWAGRHSGRGTRHLHRCLGEYIPLSTGEGVHKLVIWNIMTEGIITIMKGSAPGIYKGKIEGSHSVILDPVRISVIYLCI